MRKYIMTKPSSTNYQYTIFDEINIQQAIQNLKSECEKQISTIQHEIDALRNSDPLDQDPETRKDINALLAEIRFLSNCCEEEVRKLLRTR